MSAQNKQDVAAAKRMGIIVGDGKHHRHRINLHLRVVVLVAGVLIVAAGTTVGVGYVVRNRHSAQTHSDTKKTQHVPTTVAGLLVLNQEDAANKLLDSKIAAAQSNSDKASLYEQKAGLALSAKNYTASLQYAQQAEKLSPSARSAQSVADAAKELGNNSLAIQYYKLQLKRLQPIQNLDDQKRIEAEITTLGGSV